MLKRGVTGIVFSKSGQNNFFLLLHRCLNWSGWEFVKGGIEGSEAPEQAVMREIEEETSLKRVEIVHCLNGTMEWAVGSTKYIYKVFVVRADMGDKVKLNEDIREHDGFRWVEEKKAEAMLTHEDNKKHFRKALEWLNENG
ncbi:MAG: hypothetical protein QT03_C0001G0332 [archaeon GW2011_AR10]|uniref:NUDIX domain-containing protein n=1 Tax=Candidatus Iainarchaeum sp. TaxID=3101447 RepID=A0A7J4IQM6_9ARCH|nr:MAG: hypothetical protein QT03_C0001G0332 [archaeon GW2011_AR10]HIH07803.1 NUDIX domain-containing protein [Candidatus Diapherotrites archaeon]